MTFVAIDPAGTMSAHPIRGGSAKLSSAFEAGLAPGAIPERRRGPDRTPGAGARPSQALRRPDCGVLSESIPVFFVGQNRDGFWDARDARGRTGGLFLLERSAVAFAHRNTFPAGCAIVLPNEPIELDIANEGNPLILLIGLIKHLAGRKAS
jgi:hypothetical protein